VGAKAIVEGKLIAMNPAEPVMQHVYVHNQIFFSYAMDTPTNYADLQSIPSYAQANHDITGLHLIANMDVPELHHLATCLVNYKGRRVICQSIIPGILNNHELSSLSVYGTVEENKTLIHEEKFVEKATKVCNNLDLSESDIVCPGSEKVVKMPMSVDVKGI
jgi:hypothetical protein